MKNRIFLVFLVSTYLQYANILLQAPSIISVPDIEKMIKGWQTGFHWKWKHYSGLLCTYSNGKAGVLAHIGYLPVRSHNFAYRVILQQQLKQQKSVSDNYYFDQPLIVTDGIPQNITKDEFFNLIFDKKFIFYTGAGISAASNIPTMSQLEKSMHMQSGKFQFLKTLMLKPNKLAAAFQEFCISCVNAQATDAHKAVHEIAQKKSCAILTENVDLLHQKAGSMPLHASSAILHAISAQDILEIDVVVCIGLSHDDRGLLRYLKKHNPHIKFIALDIVSPNYLSSSDYLVHEDLQLVLVWLFEKIKNNY